MQQEKQEEVKQDPKVYNYTDLMEFENKQIYSSFGRMIDSKKDTAPKYGFGTADRAQQAKVFQSKELAKTGFVDKNIPGPNYLVTDKFTYKKHPQWKFGTDDRNTLGTAPKYDFYLRADIDYDPQVADEKRRKKNPTIRIGLESRFANDPKRLKGTPGPLYNPCLRQDVPKQPQFSFGFRREIAGKSPLAPNTSTKENVGPGSYMRQNFPNVSIIKEEPTWSLPKAPRQGLENKCWDRYQTYDMNSKAIGKQTNSKKKTMPEISFGKAHRDTKTGVFKDHMVNQASKIRIQHPEF